MTPFDLAMFAAKLIAGTLAYLLIGWIGSSDDKRVAGAMLTFPVLNGIGLVASPDKDPVALTQAMMPIIVLNGCLCFGFIVAFRWARRVSDATDRALSYATAAAGALIWCLAAAFLAPPLAAYLPSSEAIAALYIAATTVAALLLWSDQPPRPAPRAAAAPVTFIALWLERRWRVAFFASSLFLLLIAAQVGDAAAIGRLSALPLVPLFVLAGLAIDDRDSLPAIRDTIFLGPGLAMVFVLALTGFLAGLDRTAYWTPAILALGIGWTACILAIRYGVPPLATALDRGR